MAIKEAGPAYTRVCIPVPIAVTDVLDTAGAVTILDGYTPGFWGSVERIEFIPQSDAAGAGADQTLSVRKGAAAGSVIATVNPTLATAVLGGAGLATDVAAADDATARFSPLDTLSVTKEGSGTAFSAGGGTLLIWVRQRPQSRQ